MSDNALRDELTKLKEQVAELQSARTQPPFPPDLQVPDAATEESAMTGAGQSDQDGVAFEGAEQKDAEEQIREPILTLCPMTV